MSIEDIFHERTQLIDIFFTENPNSTIKINDQIFNKIQFLEQALLFGIFPLLETQRYNPDIDRNLLKKVLKDNPGYISMVDPNVL